MERSGPFQACNGNAFHFTIQNHKLIYVLHTRFSLMLRKSAKVNVTQFERGPLLGFYAA